MFRLIALSVLLMSTPVQAGLINIHSGIDDVCVSCTTTPVQHGGWISSENFQTATASQEATWVNANSGGKLAYRIYEADLNRIGQEMQITSLWLSADDDVAIKVGGKLIWDSYDYRPNSDVWRTAIDVVALVGEFVVSGNERLNFYVDNNGRGPTGLIYAGTAVSVPEPGTIALLLLGLASVGLSRFAANLS